MLFSLLLLILALCSFSLATRPGVPSKYFVQSKCTYPWGQPGFVTQTWTDGNSQKIQSFGGDIVTLSTPNGTYSIRPRQNAMSCSYSFFPTSIHSVFPNVSMSNWTHVGFETRKGIVAHVWSSNTTTNSTDLGVNLTYYSNQFMLTAPDGTPLFRNYSSVTFRNNVSIGVTYSFTCEYTSFSLTFNSTNVFTPPPVCSNISLYSSSSSPSSYDAVLFEVKELVNQVLPSFTDPDSLSCPRVSKRYRDFINKYGKPHRSCDDHRIREKVFLDNVRRIAQLNQDAKERKSSVRFAVNEMADMTVDEIRNFRLMKPVSQEHVKQHKAEMSLRDQEEGGKVNVNQPSTSSSIKKSIRLNTESPKRNLRTGNFVNPVPPLPAPKFYDSRTLLGVPPVRNQGACGSCWSFSAIGALEIQYALRMGINATNELYNSPNISTHFSPQRVLDCISKSNGCNGGWSREAYYWMAKGHGAALDSSYPYFGHEQYCRLNDQSANIAVSDVFTLETEVDHMNFVYQYGAVSVSLDAANPAFMYYAGGVMDFVSCGNSSTNPLDHAVILIGYTPDYWIVRNSWGPTWGMNGNILIARNPPGACSMIPGYSTVATLA